MNDQQRSIKRIEELVVITDLASARHAELIAAEIKLAAIREALREYRSCSSPHFESSIAFISECGRIFYEPVAYALSGVSWTNDEEVYGKVATFTDDPKKRESMKAMISEYRRDILNQVAKPEELFVELERILSEP